MTTPVADRAIIDPLAVEVSRPLVLLRLGYRHAGQVPEKTARLLDEVITRGRALLAPRGVHATVTVERDGDAVVLGGALRSSSRSLRERLEGCATAALFAATIGPALEDWLRSLNEADELTRALLADAYGSSAAIALGTALEEVIAAGFHGRGLKATKRYAPGYGDFELEAQAPLLALIDAGQIGITLTPEHLMLPTKSISGLIGGR
jgi:cobalamin-dependent methionine synthase I